ncbi:MAG TPA: hypothetical protein VJN18_20265 [Polyangiaceae bacterium]|nr:hypothetical protein [Polyangiaceae bacterium]
MLPRPYLVRHHLAWTLAPLAAGLLAIPGCSNDSVSVAGVTHPTLIEVAPVEFLGSLGCSEQPSSVQRYVATLFDVTEQSAGGAGSDYEPEVDEDGIPQCGGFQLPSSEPTSCLTSVGFGYVVHGRRYCAEVDAYDTDQLVPRGTGTRQMVVGAPGDDGLAQAPLAERRWHTYCQGATATAATIVRGRGCLPLFPQFAREAPAGVVVDTQALLGDVACGSDPQHVDSLDLTLTYPGLADGIHRTPDCGSKAVYEDLPAGTSVSIYVAAFNGSDQIAGAVCHARTVAGTNVVADCTPLSQEGTLRVDLEAALEALGGFDCDERSVSDVRVTVGGMLRGSFPPPDCLEPFDYGFRPNETASVIVSAYHADGELSTICEGVVQPARVVVATCQHVDIVAP